VRVYLSACMSLCAVHACVRVCVCVRVRACVCGCAHVRAWHEFACLCWLILLLHCSPEPALTSCTCAASRLCSVSGPFSACPPHPLGAWSAWAPLLVREGRGRGAGGGGVQGHMGPGTGHTHALHQAPGRWVHSKALRSRGCLREGPPPSPLGRMDHSFTTNNPHLHPCFPLPGPSFVCTENLSRLGREGRELHAAPFIKSAPLPSVEPRSRLLIP